MIYWISELAQFLLLHRLCSAASVKHLYSTQWIFKQELVGSFLPTGHSYSLIALWWNLPWGCWSLHTGPGSKRGVQGTAQGNGSCCSFQTRNWVKKMRTVAWAAQHANNHQLLGRCGSWRQQKAAKNYAQWFFQPLSTLVYGRRKRRLRNSCAGGLRYPELL